MKHTEQEASRAEIIEGVVENEEIIQELEGKSCEKEKTETEVEIIEVKQLVEKTTTQKEYHSISENIKKGVESKITCNKIAYNMTSKEQENGTRVQNIGETIEDKVLVEMANIQANTKQHDNDIVAKKTSNYQQQKEATGNGERNEIGQKPTYSHSEQQDKDEKTYNIRSTSTRAKIETIKTGKEDNINSELAQEDNSDISNRDTCPLYN